MFRLSQKNKFITLQAIILSFVAHSTVLSLCYFTFPTHLSKRPPELSFLGSILRNQDFSTIMLLRHTNLIPQLFNMIHTTEKNEGPKFRDYSKPKNNLLRKQDEKIILKPTITIKEEQEESINNQHPSSLFQPVPYDPLKLNL
jgi:hypothetical protein